MSEKDALQAHEVDNSLYLHPLNQLDVRASIENNFQELAISTTKAVRPVLSPNPDPLELWETKAIQQRQQRISGVESDLSYLLRTMYEEMFSITQFPESPAEYLGSQGARPGGLISHEYVDSSYLEVAFQDVAKLPYIGLNLANAVESLQDHRSRELLTYFAFKSTYSPSIWVHGRWMVPDISELREIALNPEKLHQDNRIIEVNANGFRLIQMLKSTPEFLLEIQDSELYDVINIKSQKLSKARYVKHAWVYFSEILLTNDGKYKSESEDGVKTGIKNLLFLRSHPELQVFFRYFSPSGYINEPRALKRH